ncbi:DUF2478 domain-containing protein [Paracoccus aurantiacus]|uniref:DUF2478 domain-containing protein n=1 Tax=Paracoccus aurantiacus TaxID=2599412 RepID=A0A5C6S101_9RHOB|nr:DUF2478 domain-containing protein [Paracoccus aurantiacus]TXB68084.1 DUF2478 domain-containing protein [Paracoccus aurantiacus]
MLGWLDQAETGGGDGAHRLMREIALRLESSGVPVRGAVQSNDRVDDCHCDMTLQVLGDTGPDVVISQNLGPSATGCRLDAGALESAAQRVLNTLPDAKLVVVNKYGKQEIMGRGMVAVIADALDRDLPVLISVAPQQQAEFVAFAGDLAVKLSPAQAEGWCRNAVQARAA